MIAQAIENVRARVLEPTSDLALRCGVTLPGADPIRGILRGFATATSDRQVTFVQIGSNDGNPDDPLEAFAQRYGWSGVLAEPAGETPGLRDRFDTIVAPTLTFEALCAKHRLQTVDVIHVDAEGHNWQILQRIDLDRFRPEVVLYEHAHLDAEEQREATGLLTARGYLWHETAHDTIGLRHEALLGEPHLARVWRQSTRAAQGTP